MGYKVVYEGGQGEIIEKKSRFICTVKPVETEEEATAFNTGMQNITAALFPLERITGLHAARMTVNRLRRRDAQCWIFL